jgi:hypothetical protein
MPSAAPTYLSLPQLRDSLRSITPPARLVAPRVLRRLTRRAATARAPLRNTQIEGLCIDPASAHRWAIDTQLGLDPTSPIPAELTLIPTPSSGWLRDTPGHDVLLHVWRQIARAVLRRRLHQQRLSTRLDPSFVNAQVRSLGRPLFDEIQSILHADHAPADHSDDVSVYCEFVARYAPIRHIAPERLADTFPGIDDPEVIDHLIARHLDVAATINGVRPTGASDPDPEPVPSDDDDGDPPVEAPSDSSPRLRLPQAALDHLWRQAESAASRGNDARAAILWTRAALRTTPARAGTAASLAQRSLDRLAERLETALSHEPSERKRWVQALQALRGPAAHGFRAPAARLLYDLQLVCVDHERPVARIDLIEWALSLGRRPIRRFLPNQRDVLVLRNLRRAVGRIGRVALPSQDRRALLHWLHEEVDRAEERVRERFTPLLRHALARAEFHAPNLPERVALDKLTRELIDRIVTRGFLTAADLRDAVSRNDIKLPDTSAREFLHGDRLLRADRRLSIALQGVYRRAEVYLRALLKGSSVAFGTPLGRLITRFAVVPFGGAFVALEGLQHLFAAVLGVLSPRHSPGSGHASQSAPVHLVSTPSVLALGTFILAVMHIPAVRDLVARGLRALAWGLKALVVDLPNKVLSLPAIQAFLASPLARQLWDWVLHPLIPASAVTLLVHAFTRDSTSTLIVGLAAYLASLGLCNTRLATLIEEELQDRLIDVWQRIRVDLLPGLYRAIMGFFHRVLETVDSILYSVDEWLRFRTGESRLTLVVKGVCGMIWAVFAYIVRFVMNLLVEPQVNPIKHFPVVTVAHKITLPFMLALPPLFMRPPLGLSKMTADLLAASMQLLLPGVFGFLIWELKENWRLYSSNRSRDIRPVPIGSHGETMVRLLRPGFHSGTIPRAFARLRRAGDQGLGLRGSRLEHKQHETLRHIEYDLRHFVERDLVALLQSSRLLGKLPLAVGAVDLATNRVSLELRHRDHPGSKWTLTFTERAGWLVAGLGPAPFWVADLEPPAQTALANALAGLCKKAGVQLIEQQLFAGLPAAIESYSLTPGKLRVWLPDELNSPIEFDLRAGEPAAPSPDGNGRAATSSLPRPAVDRAVFARRPISWSAWVDAWNREETGELPIPALADLELAPVPQPEQTIAAG